MIPMRAAAVALLVALALVTGCGGTDVGAGPDSSAGLLKPGALVYWQTVSDPDSGQWEQAEDLLDKFPDGARWIAELKKEIAAEGVTWEADVKPALGSVVDLAVYPQVGDSPAYVGLTNPDDKDKLLELVRKLNAKSDAPVVSRVVGDWVALSESQQAIDAALKQEGGQALADDDTFKSALEALPDDALSRVYVDPARAIELVGEGPEREALDMLGLDGLDFAGAWAKAKENGAELALAVRGEGADGLLGTGEPYASKLLDKVPDDAFAFLTFQGEGFAGQLEQLRGTPWLAMALRELEREAGIDLMELAMLLDGEVAFFVRRGVPTAEFTLLLDSNDPVAAKRSIEPLLRFVPDTIRVTVETLENIVVVSTALDPLEDLRGGTAKLADSDRFKDALDAAGSPEEYTGLAYVDLSEASALIASLTDSEVVRRNLEPLRSLVAYGSEDGTLSTFLAFLEID
jgi:Protein of unknown function (DUF3352)